MSRMSLSIDLGTPMTAQVTLFLTHSVCVAGGGGEREEEEEERVSCMFRPRDLDVSTNKTSKNFN